MAEKTSIGTSSAVHKAWVVSAGEGGTHTGFSAEEMGMGGNKTGRNRKTPQYNVGSHKRANTKPHVVAQSTATCGIFSSSLRPCMRTCVQYSVLKRFPARGLVLLTYAPYSCLVLSCAFTAPIYIFFAGTLCTYHVVLSASAPHLKLHLPSPLRTPLHTAAVHVELLSLLQAVEERKVLTRTGPQLSYNGKVTGQGLRFGFRVGGQVFGRCHLGYFCF